MNDREDCIIIIGPMGVGKTTLAKRLAQKLSLPYIGCDTLRFRYFEKMPSYDKKMVRKLFYGLDPFAYYKYMNPYELAFIEQLLKDYKRGIFDFGAGHSIYEEQIHLQKMTELLAPYRHVIFLRYSKDAEESIEALSKRRFQENRRRRDFYNVLNGIYIRSSCNQKFAKYIIDTKGVTKQEVLNHILRIL